MQEIMKDISLTRLTCEGAAKIEDVVAVEKTWSLDIPDKDTLTFTCTPADMDEMVTGMLYSRGYIRSAGEIESMETDGDRISVKLAERAERDKKPAEKAVLKEKMIFSLVKELFSNSDTLFERTGCAHSCSLVSDRVLCTFEDIGRHNALDKVIGFALRNGIAMEGCAVFTSGRVSGDYMSKLIRAGVPTVVSRAAVTSQAIDLAKRHGVTLYGFVRGSSANLY